MPFGAPVEEARIDPDNVEILIQHLKCAAFEMPVSAGEAFGVARRRRDGRRARASSRPQGAARGARDVSLGGRRLSGEQRLATERRLGQRRRRRRERLGEGRPAPRRSATREDARRDGLARRAHDAPRAGHLPARRRDVPGRALRPREPQGVRAQGRARLLHRRDDLHAGERPRGERDRRRGRGRRRARTPGRADGASVASWRRSSATRRSSSSPTRTRATATCGCPRCRCTRPRSG